MKYMLIMNSPRDGYTQYMNWPKKLLEANMAFMHAFTKKLMDGKPITDGVFPESKEFLAGYWIVDVDSAERALQIAAEASTAPGTTVTAADGSTIDHLWIEVREVMGSREDMK